MPDILGSFRVLRKSDLYCTAFLEKTENKKSNTHINIILKKRRIMGKSLPFNLCYPINITTSMNN